VLGLETYLAHAGLELDANREPQVALNVLEYARTALGTACHCLKFYKLHARTLVALSDVKSIRWIFQFALAGMVCSRCTACVVLKLIMRACVVCWCGQVTRIGSAW
jgi:hypothetical protein